MRLQLISDLHLDCNGMPRPPALAEADILIIAGDVSQLTRSLASNLTHLCDQFPHVVYVTGNHEYYQSTLEDVQEALTKLSATLPNLHWLNNSVVEIDGQRFVGSTLWYPRVVQAEIVSLGFTDFTYIKGIRTWWEKENTAAQKFLDTTVGAKDIVVTHHAPSYRSVHPLYKMSQNNLFYVCDMEYLIRREKPKFWLHGHMHRAVDYKLGRTRILCNPFGYTSRGETNYFAPLVLNV